MTVTDEWSEPGLLSGGRRRRRGREVGFQVLLSACILISFAFLVALLVSIFLQGKDRLNGDLLGNFPSSNPRRAGAQSAFFGTLWVISGTALMCLPVGFGAAIYLEEYADRNRWYNRLIELNIQNLAAVPSIVYGILGLGFLVRGLGLGQVVAAASLILSLLVLPVVIISAREAIRAVPNSIRLGAYALGATKWQTIRKQVLPAAVPGMATGSILALSRAIGEAAPLILVGGLTFIQFNPDGFGSAFTVLPIQIFNWISRPQAEFETLASAASVVLLMVLLTMNAVAILVRNRTQKNW